LPISRRKGGEACGSVKKKIEAEKLGENKKGAKKRGVLLETGSGSQRLLRRASDPLDRGNSRQNKERKSRVKKRKKDRGKSWKGADADR